MTVEIQDVIVTLNLGWFRKSIEGINVAVTKRSQEVTRS